MWLMEELLLSVIKSFFLLLSETLGDIHLKTFFSQTILFGIYDRQYFPNVENDVCAFSLVYDVFVCYTIH